MLWICRTIRSNCGRSTTSSSGSATPSRRPTSTARPSASRSSPIRASRPASRDMTSYAMRQGQARLVFATPLTPDHPAADHLKLHGDGVRDIAFQVDDADTRVRRGGEARRHARHRAARRERRSTAASAAPPSTPTATRCIRSSSSTTTTARSCPATSSGPCPARTPASCASTTSSATSSWGRWTTGPDWYSNVLGFKRFISFDDKDINTEYSALMSIVMSDDSDVDQVPDQRAGDGQAQEPDRRVSGVLSRPGRAAHRAADRSTSSRR